MKGTESQVKFANDLLNRLSVDLFNHNGDECETTREWDQNSKAFLETIPDDAAKIIESLKSGFNFRIELDDIREFGADVWAEVEKQASIQPVGYRRTMELKK